MFGLKNKQHFKLPRPQAGKLIELLPNSKATEQIRLTAANIGFKLGKLETAVIMVGAVESDTTNSTVVSNLALAWAEMGRHVLLIDGNKRAPRIHEIYELANEVGLSNVLMGEATFAETVKKTEIQNLDILTVGSSDRTALIAIKQQQLKNLLVEARKNYDLILIDVPPFTEFADGKLFLPEVDGVVIVARVGKTIRTKMERTVEVLKVAGVNIIGVITRTEK
ncbi:MAG: CpsD/CapB family tyrosine-protein kinase [Lactobacillaceae bacterium]|jgi:capsular exopolysaccharide synthesis family protein|nr:CpsD/CapB family tyrosine-protein kinase [Lactobacillaceae bacterium]